MGHVGLLKPGPARAVTLPRHSSRATLWKRKGKKKATNHQQAGGSVTAELSHAGPGGGGCRGGWGPPGDGGRREGPTWHPLLGFWSCGEGGAGQPSGGLWGLCPPGRSRTLASVGPTTPSGPRASAASSALQGDSCLPCHRVREMSGHGAQCSGWLPARDRDRARPPASVRRGTGPGAAQSRTETPAQWVSPPPQALPVPAPRGQPQAIHDLGLCPC